MKTNEWFLRLAVVLFGLLVVILPKSVKSRLMATADRSMTEQEHTPLTRIIGGDQVTSEDEFPFFVNLGGCGGSLIHPDV
jgi:hypothetical protein